MDKNTDINQKKIQMLRDMKREIESLEYQRTHVNSVNIEVHLIRIGKVFSRILKKMAPYITVGTLTILLFEILGHTPFVIDEKSQKQRIQKEFDSEGNVRYEMQYDEFSDDVNVIKLFDVWKKVDNNYYERRIKVYNTRNVKIEKIEEIIDNNDLSLEKTFGESVIKIERRNNLSDDEINRLPYVQAVIYSTSNETMFVKESTSENVFSTILWVLLNLLIDYVISVSTAKPFDDGIVEYTRKLKEEYPTVNLEELKTLIEIRKDNYNRLVR